MSSVRINSLELGRILAIVAIIALHSTPVMVTPFFMGETWFTNIMNQLMRFAVPLFFLIAGYFIQPKLTADPARTLRSYAAPLMKLWFFWSLLYLAFPTRLDLLMSKGYLFERQRYWDQWLSTPLNSLLEGGLVHLWFIPGLVIAVAIIALLVRIQRLSWLMPLAVGLYIYGLLGGSYESISGVEAPFFTRNGPFFSTLMVAIGFEIRRRDFNMSTAQAWTLCLLGMLGHLAEAYWLYGQGLRYVSHDFLIMTPVWTLGLFFIFLNNPKLGASERVDKLSKDVLGVYLVHLMFVIIYVNLAGAMQLPTLVNILAVVPFVALTSLVTIRLIRKTPLRHLLLR